MYATRSCFQATNLISQVKASFIKELKVREVSQPFPIVDSLLSAVAMFNLKYPSLLQFDKERGSEDKQRNIRAMYQVSHVPCDTTMRKRLDPLSTDIINACINDIIAVVQRSQSLKEWDFLGTKLISLDGTGFFSSPSIHCAHCCEKRHKNGTVTYHHQMLVGTIVNPDCKQVFPVLFEPICKDDGDNKNDCERNASKRWLKAYRRLYPNMPTTIVEDGLSSNAPHILALKEARCHFILGARQDDHKFLYDWFFSASPPDVTEITDTQGHLIKRYRFMNNVPLNDKNFDLKVNVLFLEEEELPYTTKRGKPTRKKLTKRQWLWVTDYDLTTHTVRDIAKGGRARWKVENETFNTLKTQGYHFEHNYGHGYNNLSNVLAGVMILAFLIDQILFAFNKDMQLAFLKMHRTYRYLWEQIRSMFNHWGIHSLDALYYALAHPPPTPSLSAFQAL